RAERFLDALGTAPERLEVAIAASGAGARHRRLGAAMVAAQAGVSPRAAGARGMQHEVRAAALAARGPAARLAGEHRRIAAPVDEDEALLAPRQALADGFDERRAQPVLELGACEIHGAHGR